MPIFGVLISLMSMASEPGKWDLARAIVDKHEFYSNNELITKPRDSWQLLFAVTFLDESYRSSKDCVFYRVPGEAPGSLKVKTVAADVDCHAVILTVGDTEISPVSGLRFSEEGSGLRLTFEHSGKRTTWNAQPAQKWTRPEAKLLTSSADYKSSRLIYLAPSPAPAAIPAPLKDKTLCHDIANDCGSRAPSKCHLCENGWYEIPNGCQVGPKVCGASQCGGKDQPACRRGFVWNNTPVPADCRENPEFAWCSGKLTVSCDGDKAFCR